MNTVRQPAVAGLFYPDNPQELSHAIDHYLAEARSELDTASSLPKAVIVPHAGYVYSASTAAKAYATLSQFAGQIKRVILLGPSHRVWLEGLAITDVERFRTPLGDVAVDQAAQQQLLQLSYVHCLAEAHWQEHSLEVQLPFLQSILRDFELVPLVFGDATAAQVADTLELLWGGDETVIVLSSDLSHYHDYQTARSMDQHTCDAIERLDDQALSYEQACGCTGIKGLLTAARRHQLQATTLGLCNSGDTAGNATKVVGYGSWAFSSPHVH